MRAPVIVAILVAVALKGLVAARLDLFGDEAFYWVSSERPAIWIIPHAGLLPPVTAMLVRAGTTVFGDTTFGVRFAFLLLGLALPFVIYRLARDLGEGPDDGRDAWLAAAASLVVPATFHPGLAAVPDAPLLFFSALLLWSFQRATSRGARIDWVLVGLWGALGLSTHYRFSVTLLGALLYLVLAPGGRAQWRRGGLWLAGAIAALGLVPPVLFSLLTDFAPVRYYTEGRHGAVDPSALLDFLGTQAGVVTPLLFVALVAILVSLFRRALAGDDRAALMALFSATPIVFFFLASPLENTSLTVMHWPIPGYLPLIVYLPGALRRFVTAKPTLLRKALVVLTPALGAAGIGLVLIELGTEWFKVSNLRWNYWGWDQVGAEVADRAEERDVVVADNYVLGAELMFARGSAEGVFILDHPDNHYHGRAAQIAVWRIGEIGLRERAGEPALFVIQRDETPGDRREAWMEHVASFAEGHLEPGGELRVDSTWRKKRNGEWKHKRFEFFRGAVRGTE